MSISRSAKIKIISGVIIGTTLISLVGIIAYRTSQIRKVGRKAVMCMYNFKDAYELDENMSDLKKITTDDVFSSLTIDNVDTTLNKYLRFKDKPCYVNIQSYGLDYVIYTLDTESISNDRLFMFHYSVGLNGKINEFEEYALIPFEW